MIGDSLTRDSYYDLLEYLGVQSACAREKTHLSMQHVYTFNDTATKSHIYLSFAFNAGRYDTCSQDDVFHLQQQQQQQQQQTSQNKLIAFPPYPDAVVWSPGLWYTLSVKRSSSKEEEIRKFRLQLECLGVESRMRPKTTFIFRMTTPYAQPKFLKKHSHRFIHQSPLHYEQNAEGLRILWHEYSWHILDTWTMLRPRADLTADGGHYTGIGSRTITNQMLEMLVHATPSKINLPKRPISTQPAYSSTQTPAWDTPVNSTSLL